MFNNLIISYKLRNTYSTNSILHSFQTIPFIGKYLDNSIYKEGVFKIIGYIVSFIYNLLIKTIILTNAYVLFLIYFIVKGIPNDINHVLTIFLINTFTLAIIKPAGIEMRKDASYAVLSMNMNAKKYILTTHIHDFLKLFIGYIPSIIVLVIGLNLNPLIALLLFLYVIISKLIRTNFEIYCYEHEKKANVYSIMLAFIFFILTFAYYFIAIEHSNIYLNINVILIIYLIMFLLGIYSLYKIIKYDNYQRFFKYLNKNTLEEKNVKAAEVKRITSYVNNDKNITSNKNGYAFFHELFIKRHMNILAKPITIVSSISLAIILMCILLCIIKPDTKEIVNTLVIRVFPYLSLILFYANRGQILTRAMFVNCDVSMLKYRFYRTPKVILGLFKERLKTIIKFNMIPSLIIALGIPILLFVSGGAEKNIYYLLLPFAILAMTLFFSVHYLILYYLIQPFNVEAEAKNKAYNFLIGLTYYIAYMPSQFHVDLVWFSFLWIVLGIIYSVISLFFAYKISPKTFKLRY